MPGGGGSDPGGGSAKSGGGMFKGGTEMILVTAAIGCCGGLQQTHNTNTYDIARAATLRRRKVEDFFTTLNDPVTCSKPNFT